MSTMNHAVTEANARGDLALMIYAIPNYPDPATYREILAVLNEHPAVTVIETTFPVTSGFSRMANETIQAAHLQAARFQDGATVLDEMQPFKKPSVAVLYRETFETLGYETVLQKMRGKVDSFLFEWMVPEIEAYAYSFDRYGIELVQCVSHLMPPERVAHCLSLAIDEPIVYLVSATRTGGTLFEADKLADSMAAIRVHRPKAKTFAGFGIRSGDDIAAVAAVDGVDGVIIGTAFIELMPKGAGAVAAFLDGLAPALSVYGKR